MKTKYNFDLSHLPERSFRPRKEGVTMVMDKGISLRQAEDFVSVSADYVDFVKLGFGTSLITKHVKEKIKIYQNYVLFGPCCKFWFGKNLFLQTDTPSAPVTSCKEKQ